MPPVAEVSSWSVWIFLKKSKDFNIVEFLLFLAINIDAKDNLSNEGCEEKRVELKILTHFDTN